MNIEEARKNIGKEVVLDESTKPYGNAEYIFTDRCNEKLQSIKTLVINDVDHEGDVKLMYTNERGLDSYFRYIKPIHLKLKEKPMNYKIRVTPETSAEVQELFFELGFSWPCNNKQVCSTVGNRFIHSEHHNKTIYGELVENEDDYQEITLPQLCDLVVLKRNNVNDSTHTDNVSKFYVGDSKVYQYHDNTWIECNMISKNLKKIKKETSITWQDALRAMADGREVQFWEKINGDWYTIDFYSSWSLREISQYNLRLKPKTIHIEGGNYTKEELLKIAGEME